MVEISGVIATLKSVTGLANLVIDAKTEEKAKEVALQLNTSIISLQSQVLEMQSQHSSVLESERILKEQIAQLEKWKDKASKYELKQLAAGVFVYSLKPVTDSSEPPHYVCAKCYEDGKAYILNASELGLNGTHYLCPNCNTKITDFSNKKAFVPPKTLHNW